MWKEKIFKTTTTDSVVQRNPETTQWRSTGSIIRSCYGVEDGRITFPWGWKWTMGCMSRVLSELHPPRLLLLGLRIWLLTSFLLGVSVSIWHRSEFSFQFSFHVRMEGNIHREIRRRRYAMGIRINVLKVAELQNHIKEYNNNKNIWDHSSFVTLLHFMLHAGNS